MPDSKRKQLYTFLCAVCTILVIFAARKLPAMPPPLAEEHLTWFGGGLFMMVFGAILDVIIVIILGTIAYISQWQPHPPWIHKKHPQQSARHTLLMPLEDAFQAVIGRAAASNFHPVGLGFPVAESTQAAGER